MIPFPIPASRHIDTTNPEHADIVAQLRADGHLDPFLAAHDLDPADVWRIDFDPETFTVYEFHRDRVTFPAPGATTGMHVAADCPLNVTLDVPDGSLCYTTRRLMYLTPVDWPTVDLKRISTRLDR